MRNRIATYIGIGIMAAALLLSGIDPKLPVVQAFGCPAYPSASQLANCGGCNLVEFSTYVSNGVTYYDCVYNCWACPGPGNDPMTIEGYVETHN